MLVEENSSKGNRKEKEPSTTIPPPPPTVNLNVFGDANASFVVRLDSGRDFSFTFYNDK